MQLDAELLAQLDALRRQFAAGLPKRLDVIDSALASLRADASNHTALPALLTALHSLAGAAGTFGFGELGDAARAAEHRVAAWIAQGCTTDELDALQQQAQEWRRCNAASPATAGRALDPR